MAFNQRDDVDSAVAPDGDTEFVALDSRRSPESLPPGFVAVSENGRMNQLTWEVRKGLQKQTNDISFTNTPLILPFILGASAVLRTSYEDAIFGTVVFSDPNNNNLEWLMVATATKSFMFSPGQSVTSQDYPAGETVEPEDKVDMFQAAGKVYMLRGQYATPAAVTSITRAASTATVTTTAPHNLATGQWARIFGATQTEYNVIAQVTVTGLNTFTYTVSGSPATPATGTITWAQVKVPMRWDGDQTQDWALVNFGTISPPLVYMPASNFGLLMADRAILQYDRNKFIVSYIQNVEQYDSIFGLFTIAQGWADYLVGFHPYQDTQMLIFNRKSIYILSGIDGDVQGMRTRELTRQVGCVSRRSIATCGPNVLFLSDTGVFVLEPGLELLLKGTSEPLSAPIDPIIRRINFDAVQVAVAKFWNNRYYLAVPVDGATRNNRVIVFNFINKAWESVDSHPNGMFVDFMEEMLDSEDGIRKLYYVSREGGIYAAEQNEEDEYGAANEDPAVFTIAGRMRTRQFVWNTPSTKRFNSIKTNFELNDDAGFTQSAIVVNPDKTRVLPAISTTSAENLTRPAIIGMRGYGLQIEYANTAKRGAISNYSISASVYGEKLTKVV